MFCVLIEQFRGVNYRRPDGTLFIRNKVCSVLRLSLYVIRFHNLSLFVLLEIEVEAYSSSASISRSSKPFILNNKIPLLGFPIRFFFLYILHFAWNFESLPSCQTLGGEKLYYVYIVCM